jgi:L-arabinose isomerase
MMDLREFEGWFVAGSQNLYGEATWSAGRDFA